MERVFVKDFVLVPPAATGTAVRRICFKANANSLCNKASLIEPSQISEQAEFVAKLNGEEVSIPARIVFVSPELAISQDYKIMAEIENDGRLRAGLAGVLRLKKKSQ